jgi:hypothetical protein
LDGFWVDFGLLSRFYSGSISYTCESELLIAGWVKKEDNFVGLGGRGFTGFGVKEYVLKTKN